MGTTRVAMGTVHTPRVHWGWHESVLRTLVLPDYSFNIIAVQSGALISRARNSVMKQFLEETDADYLFWTDTDNTWKPEVFEQLIADDLPIVGALYFGLGRTEDPGAMFPVYFQLDEKGDPYLPYDVPQEGIQEVFALGFGCTLVKREVIEALSPIKALWPCAEIEWQGHDVGEDVAFCLRAAELGYKSYVDFSLRSGHIKDVEFLT